MTDPQQRAGHGGGEEVATLGEISSYQLTAPQVVKVYGLMDEQCEKRRRRSLPSPNPGACISWAYWQLKGQIILYKRTVRRGGRGWGQAPARCIQ